MRERQSIDLKTRVTDVEEERKEANQGDFISPRSRLAEGAESFYGKMFEIKVSGEENFREIPEGKKVIFSPSHITYMDMGCAIAAIGRFRKDLVLIRASSRDTWVQRTIQDLVVGKDSFRDVPYAGTGKQRVGGFSEWIGSEAFTKSKEDLKENKNDILLSAYFDPPHDAKGKRELPDKGGVGPVFLAQMAEAMIVPVAVNVYGEQEAQSEGVALEGYLKRVIKNGRRPRVDVTIGKPMSLPRIEGIEKLTDRIQGGDRREFHRLIEELRVQSEEVMNSIAKMLPEGRRGTRRRGI